MPNLTNIKIGYTVLRDELFIYRHGKRNPFIALEKRLATPEIIAAVIEYFLHDMPTGAVREFQIGEQWYEVTVKPIDKPA